MYQTYQKHQHKWCSNLGVCRFHITWLSLTQHSRFEWNQPSVFITFCAFLLWLFLVPSCLVSSLKQSIIWQMWSICCCFAVKCTTSYNVSTYCVGQSSGSLDNVFDFYNAIRNVGSAQQPVAVILHFSQSISQIGEEFVQFLHWQETVHTLAMFSTEETAALNALLHL